MAKKSKSTSSGAELVILGLLAVMVLILIIAPIYLIGGFIYSLIKYKYKYSWLKNPISDFWLTKEEKLEFTEISNKIDDSFSKIIDARHKGREQQVSINLDGRFSAKSELGKELQRIIDKNTTIQNSANNSLNSLSSKPQKKWNEFSKVYGKVIAFFIASFSYLMTSIVVSQIEYFNISLKKILGFGYYIYLGLNEEKIEMFKYFEKGHFIYGMILITVISYGVYHLCKSDKIANYFANKISPEPPIVELENLEKY